MTIKYLNSYVVGSQSDMIRGRMVGQIQKVTSMESLRCLIMGNPGKKKNPPSS